MTYLANRYFGLEVALGNIAGYTGVARFGLVDVGGSTLTDVWDRGDVQPLWVAPTQPRVHSIVSDSAEDADGGLGMRTMSITGLVNWNSPRVVETITLNGLTPVLTSNEYVIIDFMGGLTFGEDTPHQANIGTITATAQTDGTITAQMNPDLGRTAMAIYGVPSVQRMALTNVYASALKGTAAFSSNARIELQFRPGESDSAFVFGGADEFANRDGVDKFLSPPQVYGGPLIFKLRVSPDTNNVECTAGFRAFEVER